ncbi:VanZ family protein [Pelomonas sp. HMWF004]|nr:VanZ family protein [Pelomonas sp. HMWF004]
MTALALMPQPPRVATTGWDKSNHALAFASLAFTSVWALWQRPRQWPWLVVAVLAFGGAIEVAQSFLPPRQGDWLDLGADGVGIALGLLAAWPVAALARRRP